MKPFARFLLALGFVMAGWNHFHHPAFYLSIIPSWLPAPEMLNTISGAAEILGGLGLLVAKLRRPAAWGLIALLLAVFPANINMAINSGSYPSIASWVLWARLPVQFVFIAWVYWACLSRPSSKEVH